jgi:hypothetical protein
MAVIPMTRPDPEVPGPLRTVLYHAHVLAALMKIELKQ